MRWNAFRVPCETNLLRLVALCQTASSQLLLKKSLFPLPLDAFLIRFLPEGLGLFFFLFLSIPEYNFEDDEHLLMNDATAHVNM